MNVLLISLNRETEPFTAAPLGLALVASSLQRAGHFVKAIDLLFSDDIRRELENALDRFEPGFIGLSLRNIESSTEFLLPSYKETVDILKGLSNAPIAVGGPGFSIMPVQVLDYLGLSMGIVGEGERPSVRLAKVLDDGGEPATVNGMCTLKDGRYSITPQEHIASLAGLSNPAWGLFPVTKYDMVGIQSKRGCSFGCIYCTYPGLEGRRLRLRPPLMVADEISEVVERHGPRPFYFVDNIFNNPREHAEGICKAVAERGLGVEWGCLASPIGLDEALVDNMVKAGCVSIEIGADSLSGRMLDRLGKRFSAGDVVSAVNTCRNAGVMSMVFLILGGPGEDADTLKETFDALDKLSPDKVFAVGGIRIYPGTPLADIALDEGVIKPEDSLLAPAFYVSDRLGDELYRMSEDFFGRHPGWIYYPANGAAGAKARPQTGATAWDEEAEACLTDVLGSVPRLLRPIAEKAVKRKARTLALARGLASVTKHEVRDAFLSETPGPFQGRMKERLRRLGMLDG